MRLVMLVGLPGSGKSTKTEEYKKQGYIIHSPDAIRNELNLHSLDDTQKVFDILHERILNDMNDRKDIVYDSTNLTRKRRMKFLDLIKKFNCEKLCHILIVDKSICMSYNYQRTGYARIPDEDYELMLQRFNLPMLDEGWDNIILDIQDSKVEVV